MSEAPVLAARPHAPGWRTWVRATRPGFLIVTAVAALLGTLSGMAGAAVPDPAAGLAAIVLAVLAHAAMNLHNDWGDAQIGSDAINTARLAPFSGGSRMVQDGVLTIAQLRDAVRTLSALVVAGGLLLAWRAGPALLVIGLVGMALGWAYSQPRVALMSRGLGEPGVVLAWWLVVLGADAVQRHQVEPVALLPGVSLALLVGAILWVAEFPDAVADGQVGKRTLVVRLGPLPAAWLHLLIVLAAHVWVAVWWWLDALPSQAGWALLTALPSGWAAVWLILDARRPRELRTVMVVTIACAVLHGLLLCAAHARWLWLHR
jgi:1,4-dihydroxy-2-naphthoate octaprenyltransferase